MSRPAAKERFDALRDVRGPDDCWPFTGCVTREGYGRFSLGGETIGAHRAAYLFEHGYLPDHGDHLCHGDSDCVATGKECPHRRCTNPAHIEDVDRNTNTERGNSITAVRARATHCKWRHLFDEENTIIWYDKAGRPHRQCRKCQIKSNRRLD